MDHVVPSSTPGIPWAQYGSTNSKVLATASGTIARAVVESLLCTIRCGEGVFAMGAEELVLSGIRDPVRLFVKEEPHSLKKIMSGKLRLISGVSLVDQLKERLICRLQNSAEINSWETCPSKPGVGLDDESMLVVADTLDGLLAGGDLSAMDISGWDWSVKDWELKADAEFRRRSTGSSRGSLFDFLLRAQAHCVSNSVLVMPNGDMYAQLDPGIQLSGSYCTSSSNSRMRIVASLVARQMAGHPLTGVDMIAMGDDSVERHLVGVSNSLVDLGHIVKFEEIVDRLDRVEFCSHRWRSDGLAYPVSPWKTIFRYLSHPTASDSYADWRVQLLYFLRHSTEVDKSRAYIDARVGRANKL